MNYALPMHLRKKDEDVVARLFAESLAAEESELNQKYGSAAVVFNNYGMKVASVIRDTSRELLVGLFEDAVGNIDNSFDEPREGLIAQAVLKSDEPGLMALMKKLIGDSISREVERNVEENREPDDF